MCDDIVIGTGLASAESFGVSHLMQRLGVGPTVCAAVRASGLDKELEGTLRAAVLTSLPASVSAAILGIGGGSGGGSGGMMQLLRAAVEQLVGLVEAAAEEL